MGSVDPPLPANTLPLVKSESESSTPESCTRIEFLDDGINWVKPFINKSIQKSSLLHARVLVAWKNGKGYNKEVHKVVPKLFSAGKEEPETFNKEKTEIDVVSDMNGKTEIKVTLKVEKSYGCNICFYTISLLENENVLCTTGKSTYFCTISNQSQESNAVRIARMNRIKVLTTESENGVSINECIQKEFARTCLEKKRNLTQHEVTGIAEKFSKFVNDENIEQFFKWLDITAKEVDSAPFHELFMNGYIMCPLSSKCRREIESVMEDGFFYITCSTKYPGKFSLVSKRVGSAVTKRVFLVYNKEMSSVVNCLLRMEGLNKIGKMNPQDGALFSFVDKNELALLVAPGSKGESFLPSDGEGDEYNIESPLIV